MYGHRPPGGGSGLLGAGALASTGFTTGMYMLVGLAAIIAGLLALRLATFHRRRS
jgi:hypothetical protein